MSMQIIFGKVEGKEVVFEKGNNGVNMTEVLKKLCYDYFVETPFMEDDEEISYMTMGMDSVRKLLPATISAENKAWEEMKAVKGNTLKEEKMMQFRDYSLLKNQILGMLLQDCDDKCKILALI